MLWRDDHICCAEKRVGPRRVDAKYIAVGFCRVASLCPSVFPRLEVSARWSAVGIPHVTDVEIDLSPGAAADPVALELLDALGPIDQFEVFSKPIGKGCDPEHPLPQRHADDRVA